MSPDRDSLATLLEIVERDREERCRRIDEGARESARDVLHAARAEARRRVGETIREVRRRTRERVEEARAALITEARRRRQVASRALLDRASEELARALIDRWSAADGRREWIDGLLDVAEDALPLGSWRVEHAAGATDEDRRHLDARVRAATGEPAAVTEDGEARAGLRILVGAVRLDGTLAGLLADRQAVEGRLLAEMLRETTGEGTP